MPEPLKGPLAGVRVVDFGHWVAGPYATHVLCELGATVVKVEAPWGEPMGRSLSGPYATVNRKKLSLALDVSASTAADVIRRLILWSDIVVHNFRPGVAERLGFGRAAVARIDPTVCVLEISAYGSSGTSARQPGFDPIFGASAGHAWRSGGPQGPPLCSTRLGTIDCGTGMLGAFAAVTALYGSKSGGRGVAAGLSLLDASVFLMGEIERSPTGALTGPITVDRDRTGSHPTEALYRLRDGWVALIASDDGSRRELVTALGLGDLTSDPPSRWGERHRDAISEALRTLTRDELVATIDGISVSVVRCAQQPAPNVAEVPIRFDPPFSSASSPSAPRLGAQTTSVLRMIGLSDAEIEHLLDTKVAVCTGSASTPLPSTNAEGQEGQA